MSHARALKFGLSLFFLCLTAGLAVAQPSATISVPPALQCTEGGTVAIPVVRSGSKGTTASFRYATVNGTAIAPVDFTAASGQQSVRKNASLYTITLRCRSENGTYQPDRVFTFTITPISGASATNRSTTILVKDNEAAPVPTPAPIPDPVVVEPGDPVLVPDNPITTVPVDEPPATNPPPTVPVDGAPTAPDPMAGYIINPDPDGPNGGGLPMVDDGLNVSEWLRAVPIPGTAAPDTVGAFRFTCTAGDIAKIDSIVAKGKRGTTHWHQGFGNTGWNENSTYETLRKAGDSTCLNPLNRSAYWMPAMWCGLYQFCRPDHIQIYYKRFPEGSIFCSPTDPKRVIGAGGRCMEFPRGIEFVFGYDMVSGKLPTGAAYWMCSGGAIVKTVPDSGHKPDIQTAMATCPEGARLSATIKGPGCYDKRYLDTPNHRDHVAYPVRDPNTGVNRCPDSHPNVIAGFTLTAVWHITAVMKQAANDNQLCLDSDFMVPGAACGQTLHADWAPAWNDSIKARFHRCFNELKNASSGDICDGWQIRNLHQTKFPPAPQVVPAPTDPNAWIAFDVAA